MKKILALMLALAMTLALVACGGGSKDRNEPAADQPADNKDSGKESTQFPWWGILLIGIGGVGAGAGIGIVLAKKKKF